MPAERAYLIVSQTAHHGRRTRTCTRAAWSDRAAAADRAAGGRAVASRRPRTAPQGPVRPRSGHALPERADAAVAGLAALVRRHRQPGRHRLGTPGLRHYRPARRDAGTLARPRAVARRAAHRARHTAGSPLAARTLPRFATLAIVVTTMLISGWFAASGASAFAQMIQP